MGSRFTFYREAVWRPVGKVMLAVYGLVGFIILIRDEILPWMGVSAQEVEQWKLVNLVNRLPHWPWYIWVMLTLIVLLGIGMEGAYRLRLNDRITIKGLEKALAPALSLVFEPHGTNGRLYDSLHHDGALRIIRIGVMNSGASVKNVAVVVSRLQPEQKHVFNMQALQQTHQPDGTDRFDVNKSNEPLVFVDVIWQEINVESGATRLLAIKFSGGARELTLVDEYSIRLAIDGGDADIQQEYTLQKNATGGYDLVPRSKIGLMAHSPTS